MKNILLPTDFSENSWNAILYAIHLFKDTPCNFYLLHISRISYMVTGDIPYGTTDSVVDSVYTKPAKDQLNKILKRISATLPKNKNHRFYSLTDYNFFIESIRKYVDEKKIDCIVMGTKGATGLSQYIIGTNSSEVITKVRCTSLIVPEKAFYKELKEIVFPTDFSLTYDIQILEPLSEIAEQHKTKICILHVGKKKENLTVEQNKNMELLGDYFCIPDSQFYFLSNNNIEEAIQCFIESRNIDMICMVAKNLNYFQQILFHSKVEELSFHVEKPFLVLHEKN